MALQRGTTDSDPGPGPQNPGPFTLAYLAFQLVRTVLWWRYKSFPLPPGPLPRVTVIIPAYNEGAMVEKSIYAAVASDYPADRLEIICIDDGSQDDTWTYIA